LRITSRNWCDSCKEAQIALAKEGGKAKRAAARAAKKADAGDPTTVALAGESATREAA